MSPKKTSHFPHTIDNPLWHKYADRLWWMFLAFGILCMFMPFMQAVRGEGRVMALDPQERRQELTAPLDGRIEKWFIQEGSQVSKGDPIVQLNDNDPLILNRLNREKDALEKKFNALELARKTAAINVRRQQELFQQGLSARKQYEAARMDLAKLESDEAAALADLSRMDVRLSRQEQQLVTAPIAGTVVRILKTSAGGVEFVKSGEPLAVIVPTTSSRALEVWLSGNDMPWVELGNQVAIQFDGWPAIFFSGVPKASVGTYFGQIQVIDALDDGLGNFRIVVVPTPDSQWPESQRLKQGVRVRGWVLLGDVPLGYELWRRFNGFPPRKAEQFVNSKPSKMESESKTE